MAAIDSFKDEKKARMALTISTQHYAGVMALFIIVSLIAFTLTYSLTKDAEDTANSFSGWIAKLRIEILAHEPKKQMSYYVDGEKKRFAIGDYQNIRAIIQSQEAATKYLFFYVLSSCLIGILGVWLFLRYGFGSSFMADDGEEFLRGGQLVSESKMAKITDKLIAQQDWEHRPKTFPLLQLGSIRVPIKYEKTHALFSGDTGSGKSQQLMSFISTIVERDSKAIIWDKSGELTQHFFREGVDVMLSPFDERCAAWMPFDEATEVFELESLAASLIPAVGGDKSDKNHWSDAAQTLFVWIMRKLYGKFGERLTVDHLLKVFMETKAMVEENELGESVIVQHKALDKLIKGTLASMTVNPDSQTHASDVVSTLIPKIRALYYMRGLEDKEHFSLRRWAQNDKDRRRVFVRVDGEQLRSVKPLVTAWMDIVVNAVLALPKSQKREIWCFLDELQSLDKLTALEEGISEGRKFGLRFVLGFTSVGKLNDTYGTESMKAIISGCGIKSIYRISDADVAEWASKRLVSKEVISDRSSANFGTRNENAGVSEQREKLALVSPDELMTMDDLTYYARLPGSLPTTRVTLKYRDYPIKTKHFKPRKLPPDIDYSKADHLTIFEEYGAEDNKKAPVTQTNNQDKDPLI